MDVTQPALSHFTMPLLCGDLLIDMIPLGRHQCGVIQRTAPAQVLKNVTSCLRKQKAKTTSRSHSGTPARLSDFDDGVLQ